MNRGHKRKKTRIWPCCEDVSQLILLIWCFLQIYTITITISSSVPPIKAIPHLQDQPGPKMHKPTDYIGHFNDGTHNWRTNSMDNFYNTSNDAERTLNSQCIANVVPPVESYPRPNIMYILRSNHQTTTGNSSYKPSYKIAYHDKLTGSFHKILKHADAEQTAAK